MTPHSCQHENYHCEHLKIYIAFAMTSVLHLLIRLFLSKQTRVTALCFRCVAALLEASRCCSGSGPLTDSLPAECLPLS